MVEMKIIEDPQAPCMLEQGVCPISFETKRLVGDGYERQRSLYFQKHHSPSSSASGL